MFTGIIEELGTVDSLRRGSPAQLKIVCPGSAAEIGHGDSVAINGICLTAHHIDEKSFIADLSDETLRRSNLDSLKPGEKVNLELAMKVGGRFGGHIVQGHVDGTGEITAIKNAATGWEVEFSYPDQLDRYIVEKGSICIDGISLTIARVGNNTATLAIIPATWEETNLHTKSTGDIVHLEVDILAKYVEKMLSPHKKEGAISHEFLRKHGFTSPE